MDENDVKQWSDFTPAQRKALVEFANARPEERQAMFQNSKSTIFWNNARAKFRGLGPFITVILSIIALLGAFGDAVSALIYGGGKQ